MEGDKEYEVEEIIDSRVKKGMLQYRVKWMGYEEDGKWYDGGGFGNAKEKVRDFHERYPGKPSFVWESEV